MNLPNAQPSSPPDYSTDKLLVHSLFLTLQGEGPLVGVPAVFVRFALCSITCPRCDTEYTSQKTSYDAFTLGDAVHKIKGGSNLVVLTGGEPFRQPITSLVEVLLTDGMAVQIETNGTCFPPAFQNVVSDVTIVCSPKTPKIHPDLLPWVDHWKYVMRHDEVSEEDGLPTRSLGMPLPPFRPPSHVSKRNVWLQPEDSDCSVVNKMNAGACLESCLRFGWRFSSQLHKVLGVP